MFLFGILSHEFQLYTKHSNLQNLQHRESDSRDWDWLKDSDVEGAIIGGETKSGDQAQFKDV